LNGFKSIEKLSDENYDIYVNKTFKQSERLLKKWLKISGETIPDSEVKLVFWDYMSDINLVSDRYGLYEVVFKNWLTPGDISVKTEVVDTRDNIFVFESKKTLSIDTTYIASLYTPKKTKKSKKWKIVKPKQYFIAVANAEEGNNEVYEKRSNMSLIFLIVLVGFLFSFLAMKRRWIFD